MKIAIRVLVLMLLSWRCSAAVYDLPANGDTVVGSLILTTTSSQDTLLDIARENGLGYREIQLANPQADMWLPGHGMEILLPTKYVLPVTPHNGIVLNIPEMRLYYYPPAKPGEISKVVTYPLGIGREGWATPYVNTEVIQKKKDPTWYPPASIREEHVEDGEPLPEIVGPGPDNPLGDYALRLALPSYLIHGTNKPYGIGLRVSHGCIRLYPEDIKALFQSVAVGTPVHIVNQPYKVGLLNGRFYLEAHPFLKEDEDKFDHNLTSVVKMIVELTHDQDYHIDWGLAKTVIREARGYPIEIGHLSTATLVAETHQKKDESNRHHELMLKLETDLRSN
jgi:L,D-transpeptidase ErfK/SrfK